MFPNQVTRRSKQQAFQFRTHGGARPGAGRPRVLPGKPRLPHRARKPIPTYLPSHVTWRLEQGLPSLRTEKSFAAIARSLYRAQERSGMRVVHFVIESNHIHLIVEGVSGPAMTGLGVRIARALNKLLGRTGPVIGDTYHARALRTPTEVRNATHYVLRNHQHHTSRAMQKDWFSSARWPEVVAAPRTYLLRKAPKPKDTA